MTFLRARPWWLLVIILVLVSVPVAAAFRDTSSHWARLSIERLVAKGIVNGVSPDLFKPDDPVQKGQLLKLLTVAINREEDAKQLQSAPAVFTDASSAHWAHGYLLLGRELGIVAPDSAGKVYPNKALSRAETAVILVKALGYKALPPDNNLPFADADAISQADSGFIAKAVELKLVAGFEDGTFRPGDLVTRAQASTLIARFLTQRGAVQDFAGEVVAVDTVNRMLQVRVHGEARSSSVGFPIAKSASIIRNGKAIAFSELREGDEVALIIDRKLAQVTYVDAALLTAAVTIASSDDIRIVDGAGVAYRYSPNAFVFRNGRVVHPLDLAPNDRATLVLSRDDGSVRYVMAVRPDVEGTVDAATNSSLTVTAASGQKTYAVLPTAIVFVDGEVRQAAEIPAGSRIVAALAANGSVEYAEVTK